MWKRLLPFKTKYINMHLNFPLIVYFIFYSQASFLAHVLEYNIEL